MYANELWREKQFLTSTRELVYVFRFIDINFNRFILHLNILLA